MSDTIRERALALSAQYPFKDFDIIAIAPEKNTGGDGFEPCVNHLDEEFMQALAKGVHLDLSVLPL